MTFKLGKNIRVGQKIKTGTGWRKIKEVVENGAITKDGFINFGAIVYGWKLK